MYVKVLPPPVPSAQLFPESFPSSHGLSLHDVQYSEKSVKVISIVER